VRLTSRTRKAALIGLSSAIALTAAVVPAPAATKKAKAKKITCSLVLFATIKQPAPTAGNYGSAKCSRPFGRGVQEDSSAVKRSSPTSGTLTGPFRMSFDRGTIKGTFSIAFVTMLAPATYAITGVLYKGVLRITKGTGAYRKVRGTGTVTGASLDAARTMLTYALRLTGVQPIGAAR
jgi:uncharacterized membrane protein